MDSVNELYRIPGLYSSPDMFSPPSERLGHVIRFELTRGCNWGKCTFCGGYDGVKYLVKTSREYKDHVSKVWKLIGRRSWLAYRLTRIFVGGGNALALGGETLHKLLAYTKKMFSENTGREPKRLSVYGRTADIIKLNVGGMNKLSSGGKWHWTYLPGVLDLIYWGVESGSNEVLSYVNKGCTEEEMVQAGEILRLASVEASVMVIPGLGGIKYYDQHIECTARLLGKIAPRFITFMGVNAMPCTPYAKRMKQEEKAGENRPLTPRETAEQMVEILANAPCFVTKVGCFDSQIDSVGCNPLVFGSRQISGPWARDEFIGHLRREIKYQFRR